MSDVKQAIIADLSSSMARGRDEIILAAIRNVAKTDELILSAIAGDLHHLTPEAAASIALRGKFVTYPDKTETFFWDDEPLIQFLPMELQYDGNKITASQPYRLLGKTPNKSK